MILNRAANKIFFILGLIFTVIGSIFSAVGIFTYIKLNRLEFLLAFGITGVICLTLGVVFLIVGRPRDKHILQLIQTGDMIYADVIDIEKNTAYTLNGKNPFVVVCRYMDDGVSYIYRSELLFTYPNLTSDKVVVYCNPLNPKDYYVNVKDIILTTVEL